MAELEAEPTSSTPSVFEEGSLTWKIIEVKISKEASSPPDLLFIVAPTVQGTYPVLLFLHGWCISGKWYSQLLQHISSHGYIVVAPDEQCSPCTFIPCCCGIDQIECAADVTNWLATGALQPLLPENVQPDLDRLALAGHSKGGKMAFALASGKAQTSLKFSTLLGIDPVAGFSPSCRTDPKILTYIPRSLDISIPVGIIGTSLGDESMYRMMPPFAPHGVNHAEFFNESKPPSYYFLAKDYGHADMLDDWIAKIMSLVCKSGGSSRELMRRCVGGIVVAFLNAYLESENGDLTTIVDSPGIAPIKLDPVIFVPR